MGRTLLALICAAQLLIPFPVGSARAEDPAGPEPRPAPADARDEGKPPRVPLSTARANARGNELLREGKCDEAANVYQEEALRRPENGVLQRNLAGALSRSGQMEEGLAAYGQALRFADTPRAKADVLYDLGNALALSGQVQPALETYAQAMFLAPDDMDIKHNFEFLLKQAQEQQEQQQQDPGPEDDPQEKDEEGEQGEQEDRSQPEDQQEEQQPQDQQQEASPQPDQQPQPSEETESMDPEDAQRLLDALLEEEKELQAERNRKQQLRYKSVEKDW